MLCRRAGARRPTPALLCSAPARRPSHHSWRAPPPLQEGRAAPAASGLHPPHTGPQKGWESRPAPTLHLGLGRVRSHEPRQRGPGLLITAAPVPRHTSSGQRGVSPPRRHPQSSRPARDKNKGGSESTESRVLGQGPGFKSRSLMGCVTLGEVPDLSEPQFSSSEKWG